MWARMSGSRSPSTDAPRTRDPHFVQPSTTRRFFALLRLSRRGAMMGCGERLRVSGGGRGGVRVGRVGFPRMCDPFVALACVTRRCFALLGLFRRGAMRTCGECLRAGVGVGECGLVGRMGWDCLCG